MIQKTFNVVLLLLVSLCALQAQELTPNATLVSLNGKIATVKAIAIDKNKKTATETAVKSAIYTYYFYGIDGIDAGKPLLGANPSNAAREYAMNILNGTRYTVFRSNVVFNEEESRSVKKGYEAVVTVNIYVGSLYQDLVNNNIISKSANKMTLEQTQAEIALPSIMIVPYCTNGESFKSVIQRNPDIRMAMAKVSEEFIGQGYETKSFEEELNNAGEFEARRSDISLDDMLIMNSKADVAVYVDVTKDSNKDGLRVSLILSAVEAANRKVIAQKSETSGRKNTTPEVLCGVLANLISPPFLKQISTAMATKIAKGNALSVDFLIAKTSDVTMNTKVGTDNMPLSLEIAGWLRKAAKNGKYRQKGKSATLLSFDEILVANKDENGNDMGIAEFEREIYIYMNKLNLDVTTNVVGNKIEVTIN